MGSSSSYESASSYVDAVWSADKVELRDRTRSVREDFKKGVVTDRSVFTGRDADKVFDPAAVKLAISSVPAGAKRAYVIAVDNSASNTVIAQGFRKNSGYLLGVLKSIDPDAAVATIYFSDICDGPLVSQEVDFVMPTPEGDKTLHSSLRKVAEGYGGDIPEAIAEAMIRASEIDMESVPKADRHFILVTDSVPHGMEGFTEKTDYADEYPNSQVPWRRGVGAIRQAFAKAAEKFHVFFVIPDRSRAERVERYWREILGDHVVVLSTHTHTAEACGAIVAITEGVADVQSVRRGLVDMGVPESDVRGIVAAVTPYAATVNADGVPSPLRA